MEDIRNICSILIGDSGEKRKLGILGMNQKIILKNDNIKILDKYNVPMWT
jgi:hypothetical protein